MNSQPANTSRLGEAEVLRAVIENLTEGLIVTDEHGKISFSNAEAARILGLGAREVDPTEWSSVYGCYLPDQVTRYPAERLALARALRGEEVLNQLIFIRNPSQPVGLWISATAKPFTEEYGRIHGAFVIFRDLTERRNALRKITLEVLQAAGVDETMSDPGPGRECSGCLQSCIRFRDCYERISRAIEQTADTVVITDNQGVIEYVNPAFEKTTGYGRAEVLGCTPRILKSGCHDGEFYAKLWQGLVTGRPFFGTIINRKKSGEYYWAEQTITPMRDDTGQITHFVSVLKDMTERRKVEKQEFFLDLAREIQTRHYSQHASLPGFDIAAAAIPAEQTGGDYFDFLPNAEGCLDMVIGDVTGHGFGAALVMAETRAYMRSYSNMHLPINVLLNRVNQVLASDLGGRYSVTIILARLDSRRRTLEYVNAGHVPGYVLKSSGAVGHIMESSDAPLGMFPDSDYPSSRIISLDQGDTIVLITDGITEAINEDQHAFGSPRVLEFLRSHLRAPAARIVQGLHDVVRGFSGKAPQQDDITSVVCKVGSDDAASGMCPRSSVI
jgi:PAS domain S-box-containing protein